MLKRLAGMALVAATATTLMAAPASASTASETTTAARPQLISAKIYFGRCKDTCLIKVRIRNKSYKTLYNVKLNARLSVNGRKAGTCYDYVGTIRPRKIKWAACVVRTGTLSQMWNNALDGYSSFRPYAKTSVSYRYRG